MLTSVAALVGVAMLLGGLYAFYYAHYHAPGPGVDPMAVKVLSVAAYERLDVLAWMLVTLGR